MTDKDNIPEKKRYALKGHTQTEKKQLRINYQAELNDPQLRAVRNIRGPQLVIAGAGSGKTRTLVYRLAYLIEQGVEPGAILLLTFTRRSAQEMMRRAAQILDDRCRQIKGGTFHSFANTTLRRYASHLGYENNFTIADRGDAEDIINLVRSELGLGGKEKRFPKKQTLLNIFSKSTNTGRPIARIIADEYPQFQEEESQICQLADQYQIYKHNRSIMDYDDLLINLKDLLLRFSAVRERLADDYQFLMIDEFQDTNSLQADIAGLLASKHGNIMAVGDDCQSIYAFRGANFRNIMDFPKRFPGTTITTLEQNYRSTQPILKFTNAVIDAAEEKYQKVLFSDIESENKPVFIRPTNFEEQAGFVAQKVLELREEEVALSDIAVLFRAGWHSNELEVELSSRNIPFVKYGGLKFVEASHVKDLVALLRIVQNPQDSISWQRQLLLLEGVGPRAASNIIQHVIGNRRGPGGLIDSEFSKQKYSSSLRKLSLAISAAMQAASPEEAAIEARNYYMPLLRVNYDDFKKREDDIDSIVRIATGYQKLQDFLDDLSLEPPERSQVGATATEADDEKLVLSTIHSAKGLEWHTVFVISVIDGFLPSSKALGSVEEIEEERRLMYVACTRAKKNLFLISPQLSYSRGFSSMGPGFAFSEPSRFLSEIISFEKLTDEWVLTDY